MLVIFQTDFYGAADHLRNQHFLAAEFFTKWPIAPESGLSSINVTGFILIVFLPEKVAGDRYRFTIYEEGNLGSNLYLDISWLLKRTFVKIKI
jgi:hypothetical protein